MQYKKNYLFIVIAALFLSTIGIFVNFIDSNTHFMSINFYRVFFGFITLLILCPIFDKNAFKVKKKDILIYILIGFLLALSLSLNNIAFLNAPVQNVSLITSLFPIFVLFFAYFILKEKITITKLIAIIIAIIGLIIINPLQSKGSIGNILSLIVALIDGLLIVLMRKEDETQNIGDVMWFFLFATLFLLPTIFIYGGNKITMPLLFLGIFSTGLAYLFYNLGLEKVESEIASMIILILAPLSAITLSVIILKETLSLRIIIGGSILLLSGLYLNISKFIKIKKVK